jgi:hypothetical protein
MDKYEETEWFLPDQFPVRPGVYRTKHVRFEGEKETLQVQSGFSYWTGKYWGVTERFTTDCLFKASQYPARQQTKMWKGIVKDEKRES